MAGTAMHSDDDLLAFSTNNLEVCAILLGPDVIANEVQAGNNIPDWRTSSTGSHDIIRSFIVVIDCSVALW